jgi:hypothetical protein
MRGEDVLLMLGLLLGIASLCVGVFAVGLALGLAL